jgi:hypothetical protein
MEGQTYIDNMLAQVPTNHVVHAATLGNKANVHRVLRAGISHHREALLGVIIRVITLTINDCNAS